MTEQEMLNRIKELEEQSLAQEETIARLQNVVNAQAVNNLRLIRSNTNLKNDLKKFKKEIQGLSEYQNFLEILTGIYESNSHYENIQANMQISLTELAARFQARSAVLFKQMEDGSFKIINTAIQYIESNEDKRDAGIQASVEFMKFNEEFPTIFEELKTSEPISPKVYDMANCDKQSKLCEINGITDMTVTPVITNKGMNYILAIINPQKKVEHSILSCVAIAYANTATRIMQERLVEQLSITDNLTGLYDHTYFTRITQKLEQEQTTHVGYIMVDLFRLKHVNDNYGHEAGDTYIRTIALILQKHFLNDLVFRLGGDEFGVITVGKDLHYIANKISAINEEIASTTFLDRFGNPFEARIDTGVDFTTEPVVFRELTHNADIRMNDNKNEYYKTHGLNRRK